MSTRPYALESATALVTGASSGLGRGFALALARAGAKVAVAARRAERLKQLVEEIRAAGGQALAVPLDVTRSTDIAQALAAVEAAFGAVDVLVNNAGMNIRKPLVAVEEADYDSVMDTDLKAVFFVAQAVARRLIELGRPGRIVNISSLAAQRAVRGMSVYGAAKAGVAQLTRAMALEWAQDGINVNAILPGFVETELNTRFLHSEGGRQMIASLVRQRIPGPESLEAVLLMLVATRTDAVTGSLIVVDDAQGFNVH